VVASASASKTVFDDLERLPLSENLSGLLARMEQQAEGHEVQWARAPE
jgi:hypothetical protein